MKINLSETELKVGKYSCQSVTIYKKSEGYEAHLNNIKGITKVVPVISKFTGKQETRWDGTKITKSLKLKKKIKSKTFDYLGVPLKQISWIRKGEDCYFAKNEKGNYINYYEPSPTSQTSPNGDFSKEKEHNISLKESSTEDSQISSNDKTSPNPNIIRNSDTSLAGLVQLKYGKNLYT